MTSGEIAAVITAAAALVTAIGGLLHSVQTRRQIQQPVSLPHAETERADGRDVPLGFTQPESRYRPPHP